MNYADSEKIDMILRSAGLRKVIDPTIADIIIMNTCSVRQKGEDRVFGFMNEISRFHKNNNTDKAPLFGITGCMVRKSGIARKYLLEKGDELSKKTYISKDYKRKSAEKITLLESAENLSNYDDELFLRSPLIDFVFRIEEVSFLSKILSLITGENIGNDAKWNEYLAVKQLQENPVNANIIIQTGCDNFCTFCIVPHTRGREISRPMNEIIDEIKETVKNGTKEITLLGQNVNSYGKEIKAKLWDIEEMKWIKEHANGWEVRLKIAIDIDDTLMKVWHKGIFEEYKNIYWKNLAINDVKTHGFNGDDNLRNLFFKYYYLYHDEFPMYEEARDTLIKLHSQWDELYLLTSRPEKDKNITKNWVNREFGEWFFRDILFTCDFWVDDKSIVAEKIQFDIVVDDAAHHIEKYHENTNSHILIFNQPWNEDIREEWKKNRVHNWKEIANKIDIIQNKRSFVTPFRELLENINTIDGLDRIRFTSSNPHDMTRDILDAHFELEKMCPYLHFALQSGSDTILRRMNRKHTYEDFKTQVKYLRSRDPLFSISTDIIVGFPGETEEEFQETAQAMKECEFDFAYIARYSSRSGTIATIQYEDDISPEEKARRWTILNNILRESVESRAKLMIGREETIIISWNWKDDTWVGRTRNFKEVFIPMEWNIQIWDILRVKIESFDTWVLRWRKV